MDAAAQSRVFRDQALAALTVGDVAAARRALGLALAAAPADSEAAAILAEILICEGDISAAKSTLVGALARDPSHDMLFQRLRDVTAGGAAVDAEAPLRGRLAALCDALERDRGDAFHQTLLRHRFAHSATAWDVFSACVMRLWAEQGGGPGAARALGFAVGVLPAALRDAIAAQFDALPTRPLTALDAALGWCWDPNDSKLNFAAAHLIHRRPDAAFLALLEAALADQAREIEAALGCWFRIVAVRAFSLKAGAPQGWHYDGWPQGLCKLYFYINGADAERGTTLLKCHDGVERSVMVPPGGWALFEASACEHTGGAPMWGERRAVEFACVPAFHTDVSLADVGANAAIPWSPFEGLSDVVVPNRLDGSGVTARLKRRSLEDAARAVRPVCREPPDGH